MNVKTLITELSKLPKFFEVEVVLRHLPDNPYLEVGEVVVAASACLYAPVVDRGRNLVTIPGHCMLADAPELVHAANGD